MIPRPLKGVLCLNRVGQCQLAGADAELEFGKVRIDGRRVGVKVQCGRVGPRRFQRLALPVEGLPFGTLRGIQLLRAQ